MVQYIISIDATKGELVEKLVEELGGSVLQKKKSRKQAKKTKEKAEKIDHTYLFGKWKDFDIDARKIRDELWRKK
ncbi:MAG TPA: hypothetical protein VHB48_11300 [Chitinophagaceae bacterium]|nr:hypothetical protein [Chitinophagaceae bacterium]